MSTPEPVPPARPALLRVLARAVFLAAAAIGVALWLGSQTASAAPAGIGYDFESNNAWNVVTSSGSVTLTKATDTAQRYEGRASLKLSYNLATTGNDWAFIERDITADTRALGSSTVDSVSLWVYSPSPQAQLLLWIKMAETDGSEYESNGWWLTGNQYQLNYSGWRKIVVPMSSMSLASYSSDSDPGLQLSTVRYLRIGLDDATDSAVISGSVQLDNFTFHVPHTARNYGMDSLDGWSTTTSGAGSSLAPETDGTSTVEGTAGIRLPYAFSSGGSDWGFIERDISGDMGSATSSTVSRVSLWVYSPQSQPDLRLWVKLAEADGSEYESNGWWLSANQYQMNFTGWRRIVIPFSDMTLASYSSDSDTGLQVASIKYLRIGVDDVPDTSNISGSVTIDDLRFDAPDPTNSVTSWSDNTGGGSIHRNGRYEASFTTSSSYSNPYDPDVVDARAVIQQPSGDTVSVPAFWYAGYTRALVSGTEQLTASGGSHWEVRYSPRTAGTYTYYLEILDKGTNQFIRYPTGSGTKSFTASSTLDKGFLRVSPADHAYLEFDDGSPYVGIGHNIVGWEWDGGGATGTDNRRGTYDYDDWLTSMHSNGANLAHFDFSEGDQLEWTANATELPYSASWGGLGTINQQTAWKMDYRFDEATSLGIDYRISLFHWEDFDTETGNFPDWGWNRNPYNTANGGPAASVTEFLNGRTAIDSEKKLLRYVMARYGYSSNVLAWELWNEIDLADFGSAGFSGTEPTITDWHAEMSRYLKEIDPNRHLITSSFSGSTLGDPVWNLDTIDVTTFHRYTFYNQFYPGGFEQYDTEQALDYIVNDRRTRIDKPVIAGEFALSPAGDIQRNYDPTGIAFHNQLWASLMAKSFGTAMHWTWGSYIAANDLYYHYKAVNTVLGSADLRGTTEQKYFPSVLHYDNDSTTGWSTSASSGSSLTIAADTSQKRDGTGSLKLTYSLGTSGADSARIQRDISSDLSGTSTWGIDKVSVWVYNPTSTPDARLLVRLVESDGSEYEAGSGAQYQLNWTGWRRIDVPLSTMVLAAGSSDPDTGLQLSSVRYLQVALDDSPDTATVSGSIYVDRVILSDSIRYLSLTDTQHAYLWVQDWHHTFIDRQDFASPAVAGQSVTLTGMTSGTYTVKFYDTYTGSLLSTVSVPSSGSNLTISIPDFTADVAVTAVKQ